MPSSAQPETAGHDEPQYHSHRSHGGYEVPFEIMAGVPRMSEGTQWCHQGEREKS